MSIKYDPSFKPLKETDRKVANGIYAFQLKTREDIFGRANNMRHVDPHHPVPGAFTYQGSYGYWLVYCSAGVIGYGDTLIEAAFNAGKYFLRYVLGWKRPED